MLELESVSKTYASAGARLVVLDSVDLRVDRGAFCALVGPSGSGKSTLLNIVGLLDRPSGGRISIDGESVTQASPADRARLRNRLIGFVFQSFHLLPRLNAWQNVALPLQYRGVPRAERRARAEAMLARVGLAPRSTHLPSQLSGGQSQRVAIARALVGEPRLLLADEPTGALDSATARDIVALLRTFNEELALTVLMVTHDEALAASCPRRIAFADGRIRSGAAA